MTTDYFKNKKNIPDSAPLPRPSSYGEDPPEPKSGAAEPSEYARKWFIYYAKIFQGVDPGPWDGGEGLANEKAGVAFGHLLK